MRIPGTTASVSDSSKVRRVEPFEAEINPAAHGYVEADWVVTGDLLFTCRLSLWQRLCHEVGDFFHHVGYAFDGPHGMEMIDYSQIRGGSRLLSDVMVNNIVGVARYKKCEYCAETIVKQAIDDLEADLPFAWSRSAFTGLVRLAQIKRGEQGHSAKAALALAKLSERLNSRQRWLCSNYVIEATRNCCCRLEIEPLMKVSDGAQRAIVDKLVLPHDLWRSTTLESRFLVK